MDVTGNKLLRHVRKMTGRICHPGALVCFCTILDGAITAGGCLAGKAKIQSPELVTDSSKPVTGSISAGSKRQGVKDSSPHPLWTVRLQNLCGKSSPALTRAVEGLAKLTPNDSPPLDSLQLAQWLRSRGVPLVRPQLWALSGAGLTGSEVLRRYQAWASSRPTTEVHWCGVGYSYSSGQNLRVTVVTAPLLGRFLLPVADTVRVGQWLTIRARVSGARAGKVVVMGPRDRPRTLLTAFDARSGTIAARFSADQPGEWTIQVLADRGTGPLPVLEASTYAGSKARSVPATSMLAPGEDIAAHVSHPTANALLEMINAARRQNHLVSLEWSTVDERAAKRHLYAMRRAGLVAHDVGDGSPRERLEALGVSPLMVGENVARAPSLRLAHRALWASPSHRANLLNEHFTHTGIAVEVDERGRVWVVEVFSREIH